MADNLTPKEEFLLNPVEEHNITDAAIASFETNFKHPVKVTVPITPQQDLHGMPYPYPAGASVNLIPDGTDTSNGYVDGYYLRSDGTTYANASWYISEYFVVDSSVTYTWSNSGASSASDGPSICFYDENKEFISGFSANQLRSQTFNPLEGAVYARSSQSKYTATTNNKFQLEVGSTATAYRRYSNICPIEGFTGCNIDKRGKNVLKVTAQSATVQGITYTVNSDGSITANGTATGTANFYLARDLQNILPFDNYTMIGIGTTNNFMMTSVRRANNSDYYADSKNGNAASVVLNSNVSAWNIYIHTSAGVVLNNITIKPLLVISTETDYTFESYMGHTIPISWKHAEGTYEFEPIQAGEGDPSPDNVRPISPALTLTRDDNSVLTVYGGSITFRDDGTSKITEMQRGIIIDSSTVISSAHNNNSGRFRVYYNIWADLFSAWSGRMYSVGAINNNSTAPAYAQYDQAFTNGTNVGIMPPSTVQDTESYLSWLDSMGSITAVFSLKNSVTYTLSQAETQRVVVALGDKVTTTVYGGTVTLNEDGSADLVANSIKLEMSTARITAATNAFQITVTNLKNSNKTNAPLYCTCYKSGYGYGVSQVSSIPDFTIASRGAFNILYFKDSRFSYSADSIPDLKAALEGQYVCYTTENPLKSYHFPNVGQLKAFLGQNNVWSDIGNVDVKYLTQNSATGLEYRGDRALELRRRAMIGDAPTIHTTTGSEETGGLASFKSYIKAPVKKIEIPFGPKQDLHGYDHPWPAGGGKNLIPGFDNTTFWNTTGYIRSDGTITSHDVYRTSDYLAITPNSTYTYVSYNSGGGKQWRGVLVYDSEKSPIESSFQEIQGNVLIFTTPENAAYLRLYSMIGEGFYAQLELGSTATAYEPYENICPIEGHDGCEIKSRTSSNLVPLPEGFYTTGYYQIGNNNKEIMDALQSNLIPGHAYRCWFEFVYESTGVVFSGGVNDCIQIVVNGTTITIRPALSGTMVDGTITKLNFIAGSSGVSGKRIFQKLYVCDVTNNPHTLTVDDYEPYRPIATIPLTFNQSGDHSFTPIQEGTGDPSPENVRPILPGLTITRDDDSVLSVYGGTLTVNADGTGLITSTYNCSIYDGVNKKVNTSYLTNNSRYIRAGDVYCSPDGFTGHGSSAPMCDKLLGVNGYGNSAPENEYQVFSPGAGNLYLVFTIGLIDGSGVTTSDECKTYTNAWLQNNPTTVVYKLREADYQTYALSVTETNRALEALGLTQHIGPIYGGTVTINPDGSADVVVTHNIVNLGSGNVSVDGVFMSISNLGTVPHSPAMASLSNFGYISDSFKIGTIQNGAQLTSKQAINTIFQRTGYTWIYIRNPDNLTAEECKEFLDGKYLVYDLASPQTYHFSNLEQLKVWLGENNFWCDISDDITVKYWNRG